MSKVPTLCLNMIVKNESAVIIRLLESVIRYIDSYCICDTGSSDNTMELIQQFTSKHNITGVLYKEPFRDFGYNRSHALKKCCAMENVDFILLVDADMVLHVDESISPRVFKKHLSKSSAFYLYQGTAHFQYKNVRIVKKDLDLSYWGVTHEYLVLPKDCKTNEISKSQVFIKDLGDGGSKEHKFPRDISLLEKALETEPNHPRYLFYLANSYRDNKQYNEAIATYLKRINAGHWIEEVYYSYYSIGNCLLFLEKPREAIMWYLDAYEIMPQRVENLHKIVHVYRLQEKYKLAVHFYQMAKESLANYPPNTYLFMEKDVVDFKLDYEYSICAYYCNEKSSVLSKLSMKLLGNNQIHMPIAQSILSNYRFYCSSLQKKHDPYYDDLLTCFRSCNEPLDGFNPSTPTLLKIDDHCYLLNVRYVNYHIDQNGLYDNPSNIISKNMIYKITKTQGKWTVSHKTELKYDDSLDNYYCGLEDIRLYIHSTNPLQIGYICNRGIARNNIQIESGLLNECLEETRESIVLPSPLNKPVEKNWVYMDQKTPKSMVYSWFPLCLGNIEKKTFIKTVQHKSPMFFSNMRGSCLGIHFQDKEETWFLCHYVVFDTKRYYYHCMVVLNNNDYSIKNYTRLFSFEKNPIEYCLGIVYEQEKNGFLISYSLNDMCSRFIHIPKTEFDKLMMNPTLPLDCN